MITIKPAPPVLPPWRRFRPREIQVDARPAVTGEEVFTLSGSLIASAGCWVVKRNGALSLLTADEFKERYERA